MDFELTEDQKVVKEQVHKLASRFSLEYWREKDWKHEYPSEFVREVAKAGWFGTAIPVEHGGAGLGLLGGSIVLEEFTPGGAGVRCSDAGPARYFKLPSLLKHRN